MTFSCYGSVRPVYTTTSLRPINPCQHTQTLSGPVFSHYLYECLYAGLGCPIWGFPEFRYLDPFRPQAPYQLFGTQSGNFRPPSLGYSAMGPPSYDRYGQHYSSFLYQQTGRNPSPYPVTSSSGSVSSLQTQDIDIKARHIPGCLNGKRGWQGGVHMKS